MTELQLEFIQKFVRKDLTEGLIYRYRLWWFKLLDSNNSIRIPDWVLQKWYQVFSGITPKDDKEYENLWHPVEWHDVFAMLREIGYSYQLINGRILVYVQWDGKPIRSDSERTKDIDMKFDNCLSPMEQPELIEKLLLLIK